MPLSETKLMDRLDTIEGLLRLQVADKLVGPTGLGEDEVFDADFGRDLIKQGVRRRKEFDVMAKYMKVRQHFDPVPADRLATVESQHLVVKEDGVVILDKTGIGFDKTTGAEPAEADLPIYWAEVGKTITKTLTYVLAGGVETSPYSQDTVQEDLYDKPVDGPSNVGREEQIDEVESEERPTT